MQKFTLKTTETPWQKHAISPRSLIEQYGSPLYLYDESILRKRCQQIKGLSRLSNFTVYYSCKANASIGLLKVIRDEGLHIDCLSVNEVFLARQAGYGNDEILFMGNNISQEDINRISQQGITLCLDSLDELQRFCANCAQKNVHIRVNLGWADGHHKKVQTQGKVKFGIELAQLEQAFAIAKNANKAITGLHSHIGSCFLTPETYHKNVEALLATAQKYPTIEHVDFGGGFGIPYRKNSETAFSISEYQKTLDATLNHWVAQHNRQIHFSVQPGRFVVAECGFVLCSVRSIKQNYNKTFVGTDLGFNLFPRPLLYNSYHEVLHTEKTPATMQCDITGNVCESGDVLGENRLLPPDTAYDDILCVYDAGAYCYSMSSNYNGHNRPAEILISEKGNIQQIRKPETLENLVRYQNYT